MPDVASFDGATRIITILDQPSLVIELDAAEVYSEWKVWLRQSDNMKFLRAFSQVGGDPSSVTQSLGITLFLENGWRIRPTEKDHKLILRGNIYTREGDSAFLPTLGAYTVNTETLVSNLVDRFTFASGGRLA